MLCSRNTEIEKIQIRVEIFQQELMNFSSLLTDFYEKDKFNDPNLMHLVCERVKKLKLELRELEIRFQAYKRRFVHQ